MPLFSANGARPFALYQYHRRLTEARRLVDCVNMLSICNILILIIESLYTLASPANNTVN